MDRAANYGAGYAAETASSQPVPITGAGSAPFDPDALYDAGEMNVLYDFQTLANYKQLAAGTGAVTTPGDPVGLLANTAPTVSNTDATQATLTARPHLAIRNGDYCLETDYVDDYLTWPMNDVTGTVLAVGSFGAQVFDMRCNDAVPQGQWYHLRVYGHVLTTQEKADLLAYGESLLPSFTPYDLEVIGGAIAVQAGVYSYTAIANAYNPSPGGSLDLVLSNATTVSSNAPWSIYSSPVEARSQNTATGVAVGVTGVWQGTPASSVQTVSSGYDFYDSAVFSGALHGGSSPSTLKARFPNLASFTSYYNQVQGNIDFPAGLDELWFCNYGNQTYDSRWQPVFNLASLDGNVTATVLYVGDTLMQGDLSYLSENKAWKKLYIGSGWTAARGGITGALDLTDCLDLVYLHARHLRGMASVDLTGCTSTFTWFTVLDSNDVVTVTYPDVDFSGCTAGPSAFNNDSSALKNIYAHNTILPAGAEQDRLNGMVYRLWENNLTNGVADLRVAGGYKPNGIFLSTYVADLVSRGYTVLVNP